MLVNPDAGISASRKGAERHQRGSGRDTCYTEHKAELLPELLVKCRFALY